MIIRSEVLSDYAAIARLHARAFGTGDVPAIVALQRQRPGFRAELSLLAEIDGKIAGHILFMPEVIQLLDSTIPTIVVSPVGVDPEFQRQGIGGALMQEGHRIAREMGFGISFLIGHPDYYPRFGYHQQVYGASSLVIRKADLPREYLLVRRPPVEADVASLMALWQAEESAIDFAIHPDDTLEGWLSPNGKLTCSVFERNGRVVGYCRYYTEPSLSVSLFLAADDIAAQHMAYFLCGAQETITLPLHPSSRSMSAFTGKPEHSGWTAAMACALEAGALDPFLHGLKDGSRLPGRVVWPPSFDCAG